MMTNGIFCQMATYEIIKGASILQNNVVILAQLTQVWLG